MVRPMSVPADFELIARLGLRGTGTITRTVPFALARVLPDGSLRTVAGRSDYTEAEASMDISAEAPARLPMEVACRSRLSI
jgi:hypothetical protein